MLRICGFTMVPIHIGTGSLNQPQVIPDLPAKEVANASHLRILNPDFVGEGKKRYAFLDLMALRRPGAGRDTISGRRYPSRGSPLAIWHNLTARPEIENRYCIPNPRADYNSEAETCDEFRLRRNSSVCYADAPQTAIETRMERVIA